MSMRPAMKIRAPCSRVRNPSTKSASTVRSCSSSSMEAQRASTSNTRTTVSRSGGADGKIIAPRMRGRKRKDAALAGNRLLEKAIAAHRKDSIEAAAGLYRKVLTRDPRNDVACGNLAVIAATHGDLALAEELFRQAVILRPGDAKSKHN